MKKKELTAASVKPNLKMKITDPPGMVLKQSQLERGWPQYKHSQVGARIHDFGEQFLDGSSGLS